MKRKRILVMYVALALGAFVALILAVSGAQAGIPGGKVYCHVNWKGPYFRGNMLTVNATVRCTRPMMHINGYAALLNLRLGGDEELGFASPQASASTKFWLVKSSYHQFTVFHVCKPTDVAHKWWFTIETTARYKPWTKPEIRKNFSYPVITDCG